MKMVGKIVCFMVLCMVVVAPHAEAVTCDEIHVGAVGCLPYVQNRGPLEGCCGTIESLMKLLKTPQDRKIAGSCVKTALNTIEGIDFGKAAGLPGICGINVPFKGSPSVDCSKVFNKTHLKVQEFKILEIFFKAQVFNSSFGATKGPVI
ncbi:non-specific lipid-transfer protein 2-like isoform X2 [Lycium barbarum]|uniref:non-specific lipid-transfer protein 2-like isoform X2 n=1 Tax=Lycium barbarum TaxID=112863 RepID=UPI00293F610D|nr:non-specific lipid-transfer protein 2-like isoform X2 [Lycium barbarum]